MIRLITTIVIISIAATLTACGPFDTAEACADRGGTWESKTVWIPTRVGKNTVILPQTVWECSEPNRSE